IKDIKQVLNTGEVITKEIETNNGKWYQVMTMPYVCQSEQKNNGAIITFNDITELKKTQSKLDKSNMMLRMSIGSAELGTFSIHTKTLVIKVSERCREILGFTQEEILLYETIVEKIQPDHREVFRNAIESNINKGDKCIIEVPLHGPDFSQSQWVRITGKVSYNDENTQTY